MRVIARGLVARGEGLAQQVTKLVLPWECGPVQADDGLR